MKSEVSPAIMAVIIVIVLAVVGVVGWMVLGKKSGGADPSSSTANQAEYLKTHPEAKKMMDARNQGRPGGSMSGGMSGGASGGMSGGSRP